MSFSCVKSVNRAVIYQGKVVVTPRLKSLSTMVDRVRNELTRVWSKPLEAYREDRFVDQFFGLREALENCPTLVDLLAGVVQELGHQPTDFAYDPPRLRYLYPGLESVTAAAPVFYAHRDTWYGNSASQINCWTPVYPVTEDQLFSFFPEYFERPVANDSQQFQAEEFVGFGRPPAAGQSFPRALEELSGGRRYPLEPGQALLFSGAHLHRSEVVPRARISLDFRLVHQDDHRAGRGAPDPDNASGGKGLEGYRNWL